MSAYRLLLSIDAGRYREHLLRLDADSRYARFSGTTSDATIERYVEAIDWKWCMIIGYFEDGALRGAGEIRYETALFPTRAELAFSVEAGFQNTRVGTNLMARSLIILRNRGVNTAHVVCLLSNRRMQKLALKYRADVEAYSSDVFMTINVPCGTMMTVLSELADGCVGWMAAGLGSAAVAESVPPLPLSRRSEEVRGHVSAR
ncbi:MAG: GNAT family N-acetyltransferase [Rhodospirillaceae bacterium]